MIREGQELAVKIKRATKEALVEWFYQSERLNIARTHYKLRGVVTLTTTTSTTNRPPRPAYSDGSAQPARLTCVPQRAKQCAPNTLPRSKTV